MVYLSSNLSSGALCPNSLTGKGIHHAFVRLLPSKHCRRCTGLVNLRDRFDSGRGLFSGGSAVWKRAWFGSRRSRDRSPLSRLMFWLRSPTKAEALGSEPGGCGFDPHRSHWPNRLAAGSWIFNPVTRVRISLGSYAREAQQDERRFRTPEAVGSTPIAGFKGPKMMDYHQTRSAGSIPVRAAQLHSGVTVAHESQRHIKTCPSRSCGASGQHRRFSIFRSGFDSRQDHYAREAQTAEPSLVRKRQWVRLPSRAL
jgi:hypothetical protein